MAKNKLKVLFVAAECTPFAKVGGLADVVGTLPKSLLNLGVEARVLIPLYQTINKRKFNIKLLRKNIPIIVAGKKTCFDIYFTNYNSVKYYFIYNKQYISQGKIYTQAHREPGGLWEKERFLFFTEAVVQAIPQLNFWPQILHLNDWHTGLVPKFLANKITANPNYKKIKTLFTIHNLANQGAWQSSELLPFLDMTRVDFTKQDLLYNDINAMLFGIRHSNIINTVSPNYAKEIMTKKFGQGLEKYLTARKRDLYGILNGIDIKKFNPKTDKDIYHNYNYKSIRQKNINKLSLQAEVGLEKNENILLLGLISRLVYQKGIDWVLELVKKLDDLPAQLIVLGTGNKQLETALLESAKNNKKSFKALIKFDTSIAQKIYAGSDALLIPSRFEPCGLTQMIAMRYGTIPIVRKTGGLKDTVKPYKYKNNNITGTGFRFEKENSSSLIKTVKETVVVFNQPKHWLMLQRNCLRQDFSWKKSAQQYIKLYKKLV